MTTKSSSTISTYGSNGQGTGWSAWTAASSTTTTDPNQWQPWNTQSTSKSDKATTTSKSDKATTTTKGNGQITWQQASSASSTAQDGGKFYGQPATSGWITKTVTGESNATSTVDANNFAETKTITYATPPYSTVTTTVYVTSYLATATWSNAPAGQTSGWVIVPGSGNQGSPASGSWSGVTSPASSVQAMSTWSAYGGGNVNSVNNAVASSWVPASVTGVAATWAPASVSATTASWSGVASYSAGSNSSAWNAVNAYTGAASSTSVNFYGIVAMIFATVLALQI